jgi:hypothetical protein
MYAYLKVLCMRPLSRVISQREYEEITGFGRTAMMVMKTTLFQPSKLEILLPALDSLGQRICK